MAAATTPASLATPARLARIRKFLLSPLSRDFLEVVSLADYARDKPGEPAGPHHAERIMKGELTLRVADELSQIPLKSTSVLSALLESPIKELIPPYANLCASDTRLMLRMLAELRKPIFAYPLSLEASANGSHKKSFMPFNEVVEKFDEWTFVLYATNKEEDKFGALLVLQARDDEPGMVEFNLCVPEAYAHLRDAVTMELVKKSTGVLSRPHSLSLLTAECDCIIYLYGHRALT